MAYDPFASLGGGFQSPYGQQQQPDFPILPPDEADSLLKTIGHGALSGLGYLGETLGKPSRALRGVLSGLSGGKWGGGLLNLIPGSDTIGLTNPENDVSGKDLLQTWGLQNKGAEGFGAGAAGFATELATDPLLFATGLFGGGAKTAAGLAAEKVSGLLPATRLARMAGFAEGTPQLTALAAKMGLPEAELAGKPLQKLLGLGVPFKNPALTFGEGPASQAIAKGLDYAGGAVRNSAPVSYLASKFHKPLEGVVTPEVQAFKGPAYAKSQQDLAAAKLQEMEFADKLRPLANQPLLSGAPDQQEALAVAYRAAAGIPETKAHLFDPEHLAALQAHGKEVGDATRQFQPLEQASGMNGNEFVSKHGGDYFTAQQVPYGQFPGEPARQAFQRNLGEPTFQTTHGSIIPRETWTDVPGSYPQLNEFWKSKELKAMTPIQREDFIGKAIGKTELDATAKRIARNFSDPSFKSRAAGYAINNMSALDKHIADMLPDTGMLRATGDNVAKLKKLAESPAFRALEPVDQELAVARALGKVDLDAQIKTIAKKIDQAHPAYSEYGLPKFNIDPTQMFGVRAARSAMTLPNADAMTSALAKLSQPMSAFGPGEGVPLNEMLRRSPLQQGMELTSGDLGPTGIRNAMVEKMMQSGDPAKNTILPKWMMGPQDADVIGGIDESLSKWGVANNHADDLLRMVTHTPRQSGPASRAYGKFQQVFKDMVTLPFPSHYGRWVTTDMALNAADNALSGRTIGTGAKLAYGKAIGEMPAEMKTALGLTADAAPDVVRKKLMQTLAANDVGFGHNATGIGKDAVDMINQGQPGNWMRPAIGELSDRSPLGQMGDWIKGFKQGPEGTKGVYQNTVDQFRKLQGGEQDIARSSHFMNKLAQGYDVPSAVAAVKKYHGNWDYTDFERTLKNIFPFYGWTKSIIPPIASDIINKPAQIAATVRAANAGRSQGYVPSYIGEGAAIPLPGAPEGQQRYLSSLGLPIEDQSGGILANVLSGHVGRGIEQLLGQTNPLIKGAIEQATGKQLFSGRDLRDLRPTIAGKAAALPLGQEYAGPLTQLISNTPASRALGMLDKFADPRKGLGATLTNVLSGARVTDSDTSKALEIEGRKLLENALLQNPQVKQFQNLYIPKDQVKDVSAQDVQNMREYNTLNQRAKLASLEKLAATGDPKAAKELESLKRRLQEAK